MIEREIAENVASSTPPKAVGIFGPRRAGKTTLLNQIVDIQSSRWIVGDLYSGIEALNLKTEADVAALLNSAKTIVIDEAQRIPDIGLKVNILVDRNIHKSWGTKIFLSGSSALDLASDIKESALGRIKSYRLWPLSIVELAKHDSWASVEERLGNLMVFGMFPSIVTDPRDARESLMEYLENILYKDIFATSIVRKPEQIMHLTKLLASQIGSEVNYDNLSREIGISKTTIVEYLDLLEQCFIIRRCPSYSSGTGSELKKGKKYILSTTVSAMQYSKTFRHFLLEMTLERCLRTSFSWRCSNITTTKKLSQLNIFGEQKPRQIRKFQKLISLKLETLSLTGLSSASSRTRSPRLLPQENSEKNFQTALFPS
nr:AAA family ATPase [Turicimonas muris]